MRETFLLLIFNFCCVLVTAYKEEVNTTKDLSDILDEYFKSLTKEGALDFTIILSSNRYYEDGTLQEAETLAFASKVDDNTIMENFNLSTLSKRSIKKLVSDAKKSGVFLSLYQENVTEGVKNFEDFGTTQPGDLKAAAANVVLHPDGFIVGLEEEIRNAMDLTENTATVEVIDYSEEGRISRNTTTTIYTNKISVVDSYKMSPRMVQMSAELLKKAYRIDMANRVPFIVLLFEKEFPRYEWTVLTNSTKRITKKSVSVTLATGRDKYDMIGILKRLIG